MLVPRNHSLQMSSCLTGGAARAYAFELEIVRPPSPAVTRASNASASSSPSSTLSESSNSGLAIATRKPRTPRKRPNQTYNEAAALLSTAYPNLFSATPKTFTANQSSKLGKSGNDGSFASDGSSELFFPFRENDYASAFVLAPERLASRFRPKFSAEQLSLSLCPCPSPGEIESRPFCSSGSSSSMELSGNYEEDFDAESILDEEVDEGGIDSIMGNLSVAVEDRTAATDGATCYGYPMGLGLGLELGFGIGRIRAMRHADEGNWWNFPAVDMVELSLRFRKTVPTTKKKMKKVEREKPEAADSAFAIGESAEKNEAKLLLKLNYDGVLSAWSNKGSPFSDEADGPGNDVAARVAEIDLFPEKEGGVREASVMRYKEKRRTRLFSKKIRYQVRKVNADRRPRMKGRFVRRPNSKHGDYVEC